MLLLGPTTVGKSDIVRSLLDSGDYEAVCACKFLRFSDFSLGTGASDLEGFDRSKLHLYQTLRPLDPLPSPNEFVHQVQQCVADIRRRGKKVVIEGCSREYARLLAMEAEKDSSFQPIGLALPSFKELEPKIRIRIKKFMQLGLVEETRRALNSGYRSSYVLNNGIAYLLVRRYLDGKLTMDECMERMVKFAFKMATRQEAVFKQIPGIQYIPHNLKEPQQTAEKIHQKYNN